MSGHLEKALEAKMSRMSPPQKVPIKIEGKPPLSRNYWHDAYR